MPNEQQELPPDAMNNSDQDSAVSPHFDIASELVAKQEPSEVQTNSDESYCPVELLERFPGLEDGEIVELSTYAVIAVDLESYSAMQNLGPEMAIQMSELTMMYRQKMVEMAHNPKYGDLLFLKSAGDELLFAQDYQDITDFLRLALFTVDSQIAFNEVLAEDRFKEIRELYERENSRETQYVQPGICIPSATQKHNLSMQMIDVGDKKEVLVTGTALIAKNWARSFRNLAQFGVIEDNGFSRHAAFTDVLESSVSTFFTNAKGIVDPTIAVLQRGNPTVAELRALDQSIEGKLPKYIHPPVSKRTLPQSVLQELAPKLAPAIEKTPSPEVISGEGEVAFINTLGIDYVRHLIEVRLYNSAISNDVKSKIASEFVVKACGLSAQGVNKVLSAYDWSLKETEWLVSIPSQTAGSTSIASEVPKNYMSDGHLAIVYTRGIVGDTSGTSAQGFEGLVKACEYINSQEYHAGLTSVVSDVFTENGVENLLDAQFKAILDDTQDVIGAQVGMASLQEASVYAYYNENRDGPTYQGSAHIGGNVISLAARRAFAFKDRLTYIALAPEVADSYEVSPDKTIQRSQKLKGFPNKGSTLLFTP